MNIYLVAATNRDGEHEHPYFGIVVADNLDQAYALARECAEEYLAFPDQIDFGDVKDAVRVNAIQIIAAEHAHVLAGFGTAQYWSDPRQLATPTM